MQITHEEARRKIQIKADNDLDSVNDEKLTTHLKTCAECRNYSDAIKDTESVLRQTLRKQWNIRPLPLQLDAVYARLNYRGGTSIFMTTRTALISIIFVMLAVVTWHSTTAGESESRSMSPGTAPLIPTPSTQYTATNTPQNGCEEIRYIVQQGDSLESIARYFSVSKEAIRLANNLTGETLTPSRELIIPFCESTPTGTIRPPTFTITPIFETISTTPG